MPRHCRGAWVDDPLFSQYGIPCTVLHRDLGQQERADAIQNFKWGRTPILVTTDDAARRLDLRGMCGCNDQKGFQQVIRVVEVPQIQKQDHSCGDEPGPAAQDQADGDAPGGAAAEHQKLDTDRSPSPGDASSSEFGLPMGAEHRFADLMGFPPKVILYMLRELGLPIGGDKKDRVIRLIRVLQRLPPLEREAKLFANEAKTRAREAGARIETLLDGGISEVPQIQMVGMSWPTCRSSMGTSGLSRCRTSPRTSLGPETWLVVAGTGACVAVAGLMFWSVLLRLSSGRCGGRSRG